MVKESIFFVDFWLLLWTSAEETAYILIWFYKLLSFQSWSDLGLDLDGCADFDSVSVWSLVLLAYLEKLHYRFGGPEDPVDFGVERGQMKILSR